MTKSWWSPSNREQGLFHETGQCTDVMNLKMNMATNFSKSKHTASCPQSALGMGRGLLLRAICVLGAAVAAASLTGCGYSHGGNFPKDISSVSVPIFENRTPYRDVEFDLAEALVKEIELRTPYKVVRTTDADTILAGVVTDVDQRVLSRREVGGLPQEMEISIVVTFEWKNQRTGESLRDRKGFATIGRHVPARPVGEPFETARHEAVQQMARDIVGVMRENW